MALLLSDIVEAVWSYPTREEDAAGNSNQGAIAQAVWAYATRRETVGLFLDERVTGSVPSGWFNNNGEWNYATAPAPLEGTHSLRLLFANSAYSVYQHGSSVFGETWAHLLLNVPALPGGGGWHTFFKLQDVDFNDLMNLTLLPSGVLQITGQSADVSTAGTMAAGTTYHVWWRYVPKIGNSLGQAEAWFSTSGNRAAVPVNNHVAYHAMQSSAGPEKYFVVTQGGGATGRDLIVDVMQWADEDVFAAAAFQPWRHARLLSGGRL